MDLGEFGRARVLEHQQDESVEPDWFRFYGERFDLQDGLSALVTMEFVHDVKGAQAQEKAATARQERAEAEVARAATPGARALAEADLLAAQVAAVEAGTIATASMYAYVRGCVGDDQWPRFREVCIREAVDEDVLMEVCSRIVQAISARPTRRSSESSDGPSSTGGGSTAGSGSPEPTNGPLRVITADGEPVAEPRPAMSARERQRAQYDALMVPVADVIRSSG